MLAAAARLQAAGRPVLSGVFGTGCDSELTPAEVMDRVAEVAAAGGLAGVRSLTPPIADRLAAAGEGGAPPGPPPGPGRSAGGNRSRPGPPAAPPRPPSPPP